MDSQQIDVFIKRPVKCIAVKINFNGKGQASIYTKTLFLQALFYKDYFNKFVLVSAYLYMRILCA